MPSTTTVHCPAHGSTFRTIRTRKNFMKPAGNFSKQEIHYKVTYVDFGETLWSIAKEEQEINKYYEGKDIRTVINDIKHSNNLKDSNLYEGMELKIPST